MTGRQRERVVVVCPGRGTYNADEWGYLSRHHGSRREQISQLDDWRRQHDLPTLTELDAEQPFSPGLQGRGEHAAALIHACAWLDYQAIDPERYEVVAITGNSMGWYTSLTAGGALDPQSGFHLVNTMGQLMQARMAGGQLLHVWVDDDWQPDWARRQDWLTLVAEREGLHLSIDLGGMLIFGGETRALQALARELPASGRFPMRLHNHAAFHTPLQWPVREQAQTQLRDLPFRRPRVPLIDGRGQVWTPWSTDPQALRDYTVGHQLTEPYDFTAAVRMAVREFAPDRIVVLGPGSTLVGAVAQSLILTGWRDLSGKRDFQQRQQTDPPLLAMGHDTQRLQVVG